MRNTTQNFTKVTSQPPGHCQYHSKNAPASSSELFPFMGWDFNGKKAIQFRYWPQSQREEKAFYFKMPFFCIEKLNP